MDSPPEVTKFGIHVMVEKNVFRFYVSMDQLSSVDSFDGKTNLKHKLPFEVVLERRQICL